MYVRPERVLGIAVLLYINSPMPISCTETSSSQIKIIYICTASEGQLNIVNVIICWLLLYNLTIIKLPSFPAVIRRKTEKFKLAAFQPLENVLWTVDITGLFSCRLFSNWYQRTAMQSHLCLYSEIPIPLITKLNIFQTNNLSKVIQ